MLKLSGRFRKLILILSETSKLGDAVRRLEEFLHDDVDGVVAGLKQLGFSVVEVRSAWKFTYIHALKTERSPASDVILNF